MKDEYQTITSVSTSNFTDKASKFLTFAFPISNDDDIKEHLEILKKEHWKANHHCYAWRLGTDGNQYRANDDGEPSGSAGKPILGQIDSFGVTDVLVVVVRYFGGTKLGVSGLINAYKTGTALALENAEIVKKTIDNEYKIIYDYAITSQIMSFVNQYQLKIISQGFDAKAMLIFSIKVSKADKILALLKEKSLNEGFVNEFIIKEMVINS
ncbi:MAG: YigZ family protein [Saprospiraceae bacterium]